MHTILFLLCYLIFIHNIIFYNFKFYFYSCCRQIKLVINVEELVNNLNNMICKVINFYIKLLILNRIKNLYFQNTYMGI